MMFRRVGRHRLTRQRRSVGLVLVALSLLSATLITGGVAGGEEVAASETQAPETSAPPTIGGEVAIGLNFQSTLQTDANAGTPPDTNGSVGPRHIVEFINFQFEVFDKGTGAPVETRSLNDFWLNKVGGITPNSGIFDPKIIFDPVSERWFATAEDREVQDANQVNTASNNFFIARSDTDDPTGDWDAVTVVADTQGAIEFHDYPQIGLDADGLYICTQDFDDGAGTNESCYSIPKADLLQAVPSAANISRFEDTPPGTSGSWQPAVDFGLSDGRAPLLGSTGTALQRLNITGASAGGAAISPAALPVGGDPGHAAPPAARQPDDADTGDGIETIENVAPRFVGSIFEQDNTLWAVHAVQGAGANSALRWYKIDETTNAIIQSGLINDPNEDYHEPSIAANEMGDVVIGYTCSGPTLPASACVSVGKTSAGVTTFLPRAIAFTGSGRYWRDGCTPAGPNPCAERNRWGDYSSTVIDPVDPCSFWTFQEYTAQDAGPTVDIGPMPDNVDGGLYGVRVVELTFIDCAGGMTDLELTKSAPATVNAGEQLTYSIQVTNNGGDAATNVVVTDTLPAGVTLVSTAPACTQSGQELTCPLGGMLPAQTRSVSIAVRVPPNFLSSTGVTSRVIINSASVDADQLDSEPGNDTDDATTTVRESADMAVSKLCRRGQTTPLTISGACDIFVDNRGPSDAQNVVMTDTISSSSPVNVPVVTVTPAASGTCTVAPAEPTPATTKTVTCNLATEPADGRTTVTVQMSAAGGGDITDVASVEASTPDPNPGNNQGTGSLTLTPQADLSISKVADPVDPIAGETVAYELVVTNNGSSPAVNTVVNDELPAPVTFVSATSTQGQCGPNSGNTQVRCQLGTVDVGDSVTIDVVVGVPADTPDGTVLANRATVFSDTADQNNGNNLAVAPVRVRAVADLGLDKTQEGAPIAGTVISYRYAIENAGPSWAQEAVLIDRLPDGEVFKSAFLTIGEDDVEPLSCEEEAAGSNDWSCPIGDLAPTDGNAVEVVMNVLIEPDVLHGTPLANQAEVDSDTTDPDGANNLDSVQIIVQAIADVAIVKTSDFDTYAPSATIKYTITATNLGPSDSQNVVVIDDLPDTKQAIYRFDTAGCSKVDLVLTCQLGLIEAGASKSFNVYLTVKGSKGQVVNVAHRNSPLAANETTDPKSTNNSSTRVVLIQGGIFKK